MHFVSCYSTFLWQTFILSKTTCIASPLSNESVAITDAIEAKKSARSLPRTCARAGQYIHSLKLIYTDKDTNCMVSE